MTNPQRVIDYCTGNQLLSVVTDPTNRLIDYCTRTVNRVISQKQWITLCGYSLVIDYCTLIVIDQISSGSSYNKSFFEPNQHLPFSEI